MKSIPFKSILLAGILFCRPLHAAYNDAGTVARVQERLAQQGLYQIAVDGVYGSGTEAAIEQFQAQNGLAVDGEISDELLKALRLRPGSLTELPERKTEAYTLGAATTRLYDGAWKVVTSPLAPISYEAYLPVDWYLTEDLGTNDVYTLMYESDSADTDHEDGINMAYFQILPGDQGAGKALSGLDFLSFVYEYYDFPGAYVADARVNHFTGICLTQIKPAFSASDLDVFFLKPEARLPVSLPLMDFTLMFVGRDEPGETLIAGFSALSNKPSDRRIISNVLSSLHRAGESRLRTPTPEPTAAPPLPTPVPEPEAVFEIPEPPMLTENPDPAQPVFSEQPETAGIPAPEILFTSS